MESKINKINWRITDPITKINMGYKNDKEIPIPNDILDYKLNITKGDKVVLVYYDTEPVITFPISGKTVKDLFMSIEKGMKTIIKNTENTEIIYKIVSKFIHPKKRFELIKLYETNKLTPYKLVRDNYDFYEGNLKRNRNGIWTYGVGN